MDLDTLEGPIQEAVDAIGLHFSGRARPVHRLDHHNFLSCTFDGVEVDGIDLVGCDFKDCLVERSRFANCAINSATHTSTVYAAVRFENCNFHNAAITENEYHDVTFEGCDLDNVLIKGCRLYDASFVDCRTTTHVFEANLFVRASFRSTEIELRTVISNFGLKRGQLLDCAIRNGRRGEDATMVDPDGLGKLAAAQGDDPLATLTMQYFIDGDLLGANESVDRAFDLRRWAAIARQPTSFAQMLELFVEFLVEAFEQDEVDMHKLLLLHDVTRQIVYDRSHSAIGHRYAVTFGGIHLALSRFVEEYLILLDTALTARPGSLWVIAEGPLSPQFFQDALDDFLRHSAVRIGEVRPYNSVLAELVELLPGGRLFALALILASFTRAELKAVHSSTFRVGQGASPAGGTEIVPAAAEPFEFFSLTTGLTDGERRAYEMRIKSLIPTTSIVVDLRLAVSTVLLSKVRKVIIGLAQEK
ncbi:MAG TPA: hypothetical protein VEZ70_09025 [Allosphingosinicella sp.]|nr:hypothetical protein [Allosphingosinicella sp.]